MRILCLDWGEKRIGLAISDPLNCTSQCLPYLENNHNFLKNLQTLNQEYDFQKIVLGLPKSLNGNENQKVLQIRKFSEKIKAILNIEIIFWDERLSTVAMTKHLISMDVSRKKRKQIIDSQAAAFVLQGYLDYLKNQAKTAY